MFDLLIKNGRIVTASRIYKASICVKDGKIAGIVSAESDIKAKKIIDAKNNYIFPGVIDTHAHLNDPGYTWREDYEHGTGAGAVGGVTTIIDMPMQNQPALTDGKIFDDKYRRVAGDAYVDYCFWGGLVDYNFDSLLELDKRGCLAFKSFISPVSEGYTSLSMGQVREAMEILKPTGRRLGFHCEDFSIIDWEEKRAMKKEGATWEDYLNSRPLVAESMATNNIIQLAKEVGGKIHICHVSHPDVAKIIQKAQRDGVDVTGETCSHYLTFSRDDLIEKGSLFKCAPPLREREAVEEMWKYVHNGTLSCVSSDHSPATREEKDQEVHGVFGTWGGMSGIQHLMQVVFSQGVVKRGYCPSLLAKSLSQGPAKAFGLYGKKGAIEVGFDADLVILDPDREWEITSESLKYLNKISAYVGFKGKGLPIQTILRGKTIALENQIVGEKGYGQLIK